MSRITRRNLLRNLNNVSNASISVNNAITGSDFVFQPPSYSEWSPVYVVKTPVVEQRRNFIREVPGKRGLSNQVSFSVLYPYVEHPVSCDIVNIEDSPESTLVDFSLIKLDVLQISQLAFEIGFILSCERVINELIYPTHDVFRCVVAPSYPFIQMPKFLGRVCSKSEIDLLLQIGCVEINPGPPKKKNNKNGNMKKKRSPVQNKRSPSGAGTMWLAPRGYGVPDAARVKLRYTIPLTQLTGGGTTNSFRFTSNAYDVDPALGSTAMPGFGELAAIYARFRTIRMSYQFTLSNQEAFPAQYVHGFMTTSLGSTAVGANYAGNRHLRQGIISPINGSNSTLIFRQSVEIAALFGNRGAYFDDLFTGSTTSSTLSSSATAHCYIGTVSAAVPVNGQFVAGYIELDLIFDKLNALIV